MIVQHECKKVVYSSRTWALLPLQTLGFIRKILWIQMIPFKKDFTAKDFNYFCQIF